VRVCRAGLGASGATVVVGSITAGYRLGVVPLSSVAASPRAVGEGKLWLLVTSALIADRPWLASLLGFVIVACAALALFTVRAVVVVGAAGHVLSTLGVYALIGAARLIDPNAFASVANVADFGFSAMIAAWIGAIASVYWQRWPTCRARLLVVAGCLASLGIGLACRPDVTILDSEHLLAFAVGVALADPRLRRRLALPPRRLAAVTATRAAALVQR
jgi:hypothetical protein